MITLEELNELVIREFASDKLATKAWLKMKAQLSAPEDSLFGGDAQTYFDEVAYFCWRCGCNLGVTQDYWDGSETFYVALPRTEEEYQHNLAEAETYRKEVMGE